MGLGPRVWNLWIEKMALIDDRGLRDFLVVPHPFCRPQELQSREVRVRAK